MKNFLSGAALTTFPDVRRGRGGLGQRLPPGKALPAWPRAERPGGTGFGVLRDLGVALPVRGEAPAPCAHRWDSCVRRGTPVCPPGLLCAPRDPCVPPTLRAPGALRCSAPRPLRFGGVPRTVKETPMSFVLTRATEVVPRGVGSKGYLPERGSPGRKP